MRSVPALLTLVACGAAALPATARADGTVVVKARPGSRARSLRDPAVAGSLGTVAGTGARLLRVTGDPAAVASRLARRRGVAWAEPNIRMHATAAAAAVTPNDPLLPQLYGVRRIGAPAMWGARGLGSLPDHGGVPVGIVDTGIDLAHEDLAGRVAACGSASDGHAAEGGCVDGEGHGTHVAGTVGARAGNGVGVAGVAFDSPLVICRALGADGSGTVADIAACIRWVRDRGARVISMSLGGGPSRTLQEAATSAYARGGRSGALLVAAAGNDGDASTEYPAGLPQVVSVAAVGPDDGVASFSNENADVEVAAAGVDVLSAKLGGGYVALSGTSMATPHVAAAAAQLWGREPGASAASIRGRLDAAVDDLGAPGRDPAYGFGVVDLARVAG